MLTNFFARNKYRYVRVGVEIDCGSCHADFTPLHWRLAFKYDPDAMYPIVVVAFGPFCFSAILYS